MVTFAPKNINRVVMCDDCDSKKCNFFIFVLHLPPGGKCNIFIVKLLFLSSQSSHCHKKHLKTMRFFGINTMLTH